MEPRVCIHHAPGPLSYSLREASAVTGLSQNTLKAAIYHGWLHAKKSSRRPSDGEPVGKFVILRSELEKYLEELPDA